MANNRFDYPTAAAPTSSIVFDTAAQLIGDADTISFNDELAVTAGGTDQVREFGVAQSMYDVTVIVPRSSETASDKADLAAFLNTVRRINTFQWTDENGTVRTVRNHSNPMTLEPMAGGLYSTVTLSLKVQ